MISQQVKSRCSDTGDKTQCQNSATPSIAKENSKLFSTGQDSTAELICFEADTQGGLARQTLMHFPEYFLVW